MRRKIKLGPAIIHCGSCPMATDFLWLMLARYSAERKMQIIKHLIFARSPAAMTDIASSARYHIAFTVENLTT